MMSDSTPTLRKYSIDEIDALRAHVASMSQTVRGQNWGPEFDAKVEDRLRTYMIAGVGVADMEEAAKAASEAFAAEFSKYLDVLQREREEMAEVRAEALRSIKRRQSKPRIFSAEWWG